jgi:hypothetical protein
MPYLGEYTEDCIKATRAMVFMRRTTLHSRMRLLGTWDCTDVIETELFLIITLQRHYNAFWAKR